MVRLSGYLTSILVLGTTPNTKPKASKRANDGYIEPIAPRWNIPTVKAIQERSSHNCKTLHAWQHGNTPATGIYLSPWPGLAIKQDASQWPRACVTLRYLPGYRFTQPARERPD